MTSPIAIVGAGPAGMMLAYQLASNGVPVRVFERHKDFDREFRGEFIQPSVLEPLEELGVVKKLSAAGRVVPISAVRMNRYSKMFAENLGPDGAPAGHIMHQPSFLNLMHEECSRFPSYRLEMGAPVDEVISEGGRVSAITARIGGEQKKVETRLVIVCNGRNSALRKSVGAEVVEFETPYSVLWLRFALPQPALLPDTLDGFVTARAFCVLYPTYGNRAQLMWRRSKSFPLDWKSPSEVLRKELLIDTPAKWHPILETLDDKTERQVLRVVCDHVKRWSAPGVLFLGDAAHTMSPMGGQGLSMAIRDSIVAANHIIEAHRAGAPLDEALCDRIEAERRPEIEKMQAFQMRVGRIADAPGPVQWMLANAVIPLTSLIQGQGMLRELQRGTTTVKMTFPVAASSSAPASAAASI